MEFEATRFQNIGLAANFEEKCSQTSVLEACCFKNLVFYDSKMVKNHFLEGLGPQGGADFSGRRFLAFSGRPWGVSSSIFAECSERFASFFCPPQNRHPTRDRGARRAAHLGFGAFLLEIAAGASAGCKIRGSRVSGATLGVGGRS